jgi:serine/threonine protein kinase
MYLSRKIKSCSGTGSFGEVFLALHRDTERRFALKVRLVVSCAINTFEKKKGGAKSVERRVDPCGVDYFGAQVISKKRLLEASAVRHVVEERRVLEMLHPFPHPMVLR